MRYLWVVLLLTSCITPGKVGEGVTVTNTQTIKRDRKLDITGAQPPIGTFSCPRGHPITCCCDTAHEGELICICDGKFITIKE
jgi:hypothetical protein